MRCATVIVVWMVLFVWCASPAGAQSGDQRVQYEPTWESLDKHQTPEWHINAKLGLFVYPPHQTEAEWKAYRAKQGLPDKPYLYGDGAWDRVTWDADALAQTAVDMGARYLVLCVDPTSYFLIYPSKYADIEGSKFTRFGPPDRDWVGEVAAAVRQRGLRLGLYRNYLHPGKNPYWMSTMQEMIDRYQPATLWFDGDKLSYPADELRSRELLAYYYNHSKKQDEVACEDALGSYKGATWGKRLDHGDWYRKENPPPGTEISDGHFVRYETLNMADFRSPRGPSGGIVNNYIEWIAQTVSHGGNLEIATWWSPDSLVEAHTRTLRQIGDWLKVNGEAIYDTRPWRQGKPRGETTSGIDVRFTVKGDSLYAILFDWPGVQFTLSHLRAAEGATVEMLGRQAPDAKLPWKQTDEGVVIEVPPIGHYQARRPGWAPGYAVEVPCDHAYSFKVTPRPEWVP